jgi:hypothetical protein
MTLYISIPYCKLQWFMRIKIYNIGSCKSNYHTINIQPYMLSTSSIFSYVVNRCFYCNVSFWIYFHYILSVCDRGRCDRDRMVVGFTTTYVIYLYSHKPLQFTIRYRDVQSHETILMY